MSDLDSVGDTERMLTSHPLVMIAVRTSPVRQIVIFVAYRANAPDADRIGGLSRSSLR
jgi:hypothetical protein